MVFALTHQYRTIMLYWHQLPNILRQISFVKIPLTRAYFYRLDLWIFVGLSGLEQILRHIDFGMPFVLQRYLVHFEGVEHGGLSRRNTLRSSFSPL